MKPILAPSSTVPAGWLAGAILLLAVGAGSWFTLAQAPEERASEPPTISTEMHAPSSRTPATLLRTNAVPEDPPPCLPDSPDRIAAARHRFGGTIAGRFKKVGLSYPPRSIFLRVFKYEGELEVWGSDDAAGARPFRLVWTYPILRASGRLGPKRREGDFQVPEGFYVIERFNPNSLFHLSLGLDYPNASDRILTNDPPHPGSDVFIHGNTVSAGCLAMGDPGIEEIFLAAWDAKPAGRGAIPVHIFPCRMSEASWNDLLVPACHEDRKLEAFWQGLRPVYDAFEKTHEVPEVRTREDGAYACSPPASGE